MMTRDILLIICIVSMTSMCGYFSVNHDSQSSPNKTNSQSVQKPMLPNTAFLHPFSHSLYD